MHGLMWGEPELIITEESFLPDCIWNTGTIEHAALTICCFGYMYFQRIV